MAEKKLGYTAMNRIQDYLLDYMFETDGNPYSCFQKFTKGQNTMSPTQLFKGIQELGYRDFKQNEANCLFDILDTNKDNVVSFSEF